MVVVMMQNDAKTVLVILKVCTNTAIASNYQNAAAKNLVHCLFWIGMYVACNPISSLHQYRRSPSLSYSLIDASDDPLL
ncbi:exported protein of unknown function [Denitratisoma oestradiolicum]|uniref:Uncharacterized protein n=1 Tax=Denitratisoma oestradiolicum TaxID=311182 RepID=A0A6S6XZJ2_9PROT|nr:hypothetical protein CBW56_16975 [Denitratisoma oestradiolicum]CAB1368322.1 exported protein of unknown function [Denitratisoma oestradiolicum]